LISLEKIAQWQKLKTLEGVRSPESTRIVKMLRPIVFL
jgi:hypothetical protein